MEDIKQRIQLLTGAYSGLKKYMERQKYETGNKGAAS